MGGASLPPGFRFHPTDEELVGYYLRRKVEGLEIELEVIPVIDLYKFDPWELPEKSFLPKRDMEWFFFCPRDRKYPNGTRTNRATKAGYWKATGKDRKVVCQPAVTGYRKTLVFYRGRAPLGDRTDWVMHEYRLLDDLSSHGSTNQGAFALCRVIKKNEHMQKTSDIPKRKTAGSSSGNGELTSAAAVSNDPLSTFGDLASQASYPCNESQCPSPIASPHPNQVSQMASSDPLSMEQTNPTSVWVSPDLILDSSKDYPQIRATSGYFPQCDQFPASMTSWQSYEQREPSPSSSYSNSNFGEIELAEDLTRISCFSPFSGQANYAELYGNEGAPSEGYDQDFSFGNLSPF